MGGKIEVESAVGVGTEFHFTIDADVTPSTELATATRPPSFTSLPLSNCHLRILAVDDNALNLNVLCKVLQKLGSPVTDRCVDGQSAITAVTCNEPYDVIFLDISLPDKSGVQVAGEIRDLTRMKRQPHIVAFTANCMAGDREYYLANKFDAVLSKPFAQRDLAAIMQMYIESHQEDIEQKSDDTSVCSSASN